MCPTSPGGPSPCSRRLTPLCGRWYGLGQAGLRKLSEQLTRAQPLSLPSRFHCTPRSLLCLYTRPFVRRAPPRRAGVVATAGRRGALLASALRVNLPILPALPGRFLQRVAEAVAAAAAAWVAAARNYAAREALFPKGAAAAVRTAVAREAADRAATARVAAARVAAPRDSAVREALFREGVVARVAAKALARDGA
jgi:hypothetical protein